MEKKVKKTTASGGFVQREQVGEVAVFISTRNYYIKIHLLKSTNLFYRQHPGDLGASGTPPEPHSGCCRIVPIFLWSSFIKKLILFHIQQPTLLIQALLLFLHLQNMEHF